MLDPLFQKLPVTVITGFLGSGKTTLLNYILKNFENYKVAVLVNEFGDINIDSQLLIAVEEDVVELTNGCICCTINGNLAEAVHRILERQTPVDYLIVETTGLADPLPIALTFLGTELRDYVQLDSIITVIDAETFDIQNHYDSNIALSQILYGDILVLNKSDRVPESRLKQLEEELQDVKENARILYSEQGKVPLSLILGVELTAVDSFSDVFAAANTQPMNDGFMAISFESDRPFSIKKFQQFLDLQLPEHVFRAKGILWFVESPKRHLFQLSGKRFTLDDAEWVTPPKNQIVLIGRKLDRLTLVQMMNNCLTR
jgi:G3E family GTPase